MSELPCNISFGFSDLNTTDDQPDVVKTIRPSSAPMSPDIVPTEEPVCSHNARSPPNNANCTSISAERLKSVKDDSQEYFEFNNYSLRMKPRSAASYKVPPTCGDAFAGLNDAVNFLTPAVLATCAKILISKGLSPDEVDNLAHTSFAECSNQSSPLPVSSVHSYLEAEWSCQEMTNCVVSLHIAALCPFQNCEMCHQWKELKQNIKESILDRTIMKSYLNLKVLQAVSEHAASCPELFCSVPWCYFFNSCEKETVEEKIAALRRMYTAIDWEVDYSPSSIDDCDQTFLQIDKTVQWPMELTGRTIPRIGIDYTAIELTFGKFGQTKTVAQAYSIPLEYVSIQQFSLVEEYSSEMWEKLCDAGRHDNIVRHLWVFYNEKTINVCTYWHHDDESLPEFIVSLQQQRETNLWPNHVYNLVKGLVSATQFLHNHGILYLLWTASSISVTDERNRLRLADFSCAVVLHQDDDDNNEMANYMAIHLPAQVIAPEMYNGDIGTFSDVWGIGCLVHEMINGVHMHIGALHQPYESFRQQLKELHVDQWRNECSVVELAQVFQHKDKRISCDDLVTVLSREGDV